MSITKIRSLNQTFSLPWFDDTSPFLDILHITTKIAKYKQLALFFGIVVIEKNLHLKNLAMNYLHKIKRLLGNWKCKINTSKTLKNTHLHSFHFIVF